MSTVVPVILELSMHLEQMRQVNRLSQIAKSLLHELQRRFAYITNPNHYNFDAIFITCTFLSPGLRDVLTDEQKQAAKVNIINLLDVIHEDPGNDNMDIEQPNEYNDESPSPKRFKHLSLLLAEKKKQRHQQNHTISEVQQEMDHYVCSIYQQSMDDDPFEFWLQNLSSLPNLANFTLDLLTVPASTAPIETVFSVGGEATTGKRNRLTDHRLECEILIRKNRLYL